MTAAQEASNVADVERELAYAIEEATREALSEAVDRLVEISPVITGYFQSRWGYEGDKVYNDAEYASYVIADHSMLEEVDVEAIVADRVQRRIDELLSNNDLR